MQNSHVQRCNVSLHVSNSPVLGAHLQLHASGGAVGHNRISHAGANQVQKVLSSVQDRQV